MAIKLPDPGNGIPEQKTGNDEWTNMKIVRDNFADQSNAASRTVGTANGQIPLAENVLQAAFGRDIEAVPDGLVGTEVFEIDKFEAGTFKIVRRAYVTPAPPYLYDNYISVLTIKTGRLVGKDMKMQLAWGLNVKGFIWRVSSFNGGWHEWELPYTSSNVTKDSNGFLKGKSPVTRLFSDRLEHQGDDKELEGIEFKRLGVGDYLLKNTTGLANNGWYIETPKDANGNVLVAVVYEQLENNDISVKTYDYMLNKKGRIVPDTDTPLDIPESRWIDLRFNEFEQEQLDEPI